MNAAIIDDQNIVTNVIVLDDISQVLGAVECPEWVGIGMNIDSPKPTYAPTADELAAIATANRAAAYREESDPLFFKAQRGEATMDTWLAKVAEIKARFPSTLEP